MIDYVEKVPTPEEFNFLYESVGWGRIDKNIIDIALTNSLYSLCVYNHDKIIGYGRIIGDKSMFVHIQDIMVIPEFQNQKIGTEIVNKIIDRIKDYKVVNPNLRAYIGPSKGVENFYKRFGFITRKDAGLGEGMILDI